MTTYDRTDRRILSALRKDSMKRIVTYAQETKIPKSTVHQRLQKLAANGIRCTPLLDWSKLGCPLIVCFYVPYDEKLLVHPCINTAQRLSPQVLYLECVFATMKEVEAFKEKLRIVRCFTVVEGLKKEGFIPKEE